MAHYVNVGVRAAGERILTKKRLKQLAERTPHLVEFDVLSAFDQSDLSDSTVDQMPSDVILSVTGPDPYTKRNWYASITRSFDGTVKVT